VNVLPIEKRARVLQLLVEGMSMRAITQVTGCSINTVTKLLIDTGMACAAYQDNAIRNINAQDVQCDEIWSFCYPIPKNVAPEDKGALGYGDVYTWTAIDAGTNLAISWFVGRRDAECVEAFIGDLAERLADRIQLTTDGHGTYIHAVDKMFGGAINYAMLVKIYGGQSQNDQRRDNPGSVVKAEKFRIKGNPNVSKVSTGYVEREKLTMSMGMRRFARLTNGLSKKTENLAHAVALHFMHYNFSRTHKTLRVSPAMAAGISDHVWSLEEIASLVKNQAQKR
jgi:IS1 family transposase